MCCLVVKCDSDMRPHRAKSCIVVLDNYEDRSIKRTKKIPWLSHTPPSASLLAWPFNKNAASNKATSRTPSAETPCQIVKLLSSNLTSAAHSANLINYGYSIIHYMGYNTSSGTGSTISPVPSKTCASNPLLKTLLCTCYPSHLGGIQYILAYTCMNFSTLLNMTQWKNSSEHPCR